MFCVECGMKIDGARFCSNCGAPSNSSQAKAPQAIAEPSASMASLEPVTSVSAQPPQNNKRMVWLLVGAAIILVIVIMAVQSAGGSLSFSASTGIAVTSAKTECNTDVSECFVTVVLVNRASKPFVGDASAQLIAGDGSQSASGGTNQGARAYSLTLNPNDTTTLLYGFKVDTSKRFKKIELLSNGSVVASSSSPFCVVNHGQTVASYKTYC
jgi:hypothetical protein